MSPVLCVCAPLVAASTLKAGTASKVEDSADGERTDALSSIGLNFYGLVGEAPTGIGRRVKVEPGEASLLNPSDRNGLFLLPLGKGSASCVISLTTCAKSPEVSATDPAEVSLRSEGFRFIPLDSMRYEKH